MAKIDQSAENFKTSPLGFLMSVLAKYSAFVERSLASKPDPELDSKNAGAKDALSNIKIELSQNASLKNQVSNEALMMTVMESFPKSEQDAILDVIFEYMGILDEVLGTADKESENGRALINEYYDVSRLGLILNCYLGQFDNDDFFYGTLAHVMETITAYYSENKTEDLAEKIVALCQELVLKIEKAGIDLSFDSFLKENFETLAPEEKDIFYKKIIRPYADSLLEKIITKEPEEEAAGHLACVKQIQRRIEKLLIK